MPPKIGNKGEGYVMAKFKGTKNSDLIVGTNSRDTINGKKDDDVIFGYGDDSGVGGTQPQLDPNGGGPDDHDILEGHKGNDTIYGGGGEDTIDGGEDDDALFGDDGNDTLLGDDGNDVLDGGRGDDLLFGGRGDDELDGGADEDLLEGGEGQDILTGGLGDDVLEGGADRDRFLYQQGEADGSTDQIQDLTLGPNGDVIDLTAILTGATSSNIANYLNLTPSALGTIVAIDVDGDGSGFSDLSILLSGVDLTNADLQQLIFDGNLVISDSFEWTAGDGDRFIDGGSGSDTGRHACGRHLCCCAERAGAGRDHC